MSLFAVQALLARANGVQSTRMTLTGQTVPLVQHAHLLHVANTTQQVQLSIGLQLRNEGTLDNFLQEVSDPQSSMYQHYLTPDQFAQYFAPTSDQVQQVSNYLQSQGFAITSVASNNLLIDADGSVGQAQQAFRVQINSYQLGNQQFYANSTAPSLPAKIGALVSSISGMDNSVHSHPLLQRSLRHTSSKRATRIGPVSGLSPKDLASAYDVTPLQQSGLLGENQTIALFELDGYQKSDLNQYFQYYGLNTPSITNVLVDGTSGSAGQDAIETTLDIEGIGGIAPRAKQIVYEGPNTFQGMNDTYNKIVTDNKARIISTSWGLCETSSGTAELQALDTIFKQGAAQGMTIFAGSGDSGAYDCQDTNLTVDSPASDPYVTGVGATTLQLNAGAFVSESVWSDPSQVQRGPKGGGSGGGLSHTYKQPSWQVGPGVQNEYSNGYRQVPDISAFGDMTVGVTIYCTVKNAGCPLTGWTIAGGTSVAAPFWAASLALVNQYLQTNNASPVGQINTSLYRIFNSSQPYAAYHDVTTGNNLYYPATSGYDFGSGIGSPDVYNFARDLLALITHIVPTPTVMPSPSPTQSTTQSLLQNGGFESGASPWHESSAMGYEIIDPSRPHTGLKSAYICGYAGCTDRIWQTITVPANYSSLAVSYWWYSDSTKTTSQCQDTFTSNFQTASSSVIGTLQQSCNTDATNAWVQETFDASSMLAAYKGQTVTLFFQGMTVSGVAQTSEYFVDDVSVTAS
jgi:kumamolisin